MSINFLTQLQRLENDGRHRVVEQILLTILHRHPKEIPLSFKTSFNLVNAAVVCAILESISASEPSSDTTEPRYLKLVTVSSFCPFTLIDLFVDAAGDICHQFGLLGTDLHAVESLSRGSTNFAISSSSPTKPSISSQCGNW